MSRVVYYLLMPAVLLLALWRTPLSNLSGRPLAAFVVSTVVTMGAGWILAARTLPGHNREGAIWGMSAGYVNSANLGIPVALQVLGDLSLLSAIVLFQLAIVTPAILFALDRRDGDGDGDVGGRRLATLPLRNPVIIASIAGEWRRPPRISIWPSRP